MGILEICSVAFTISIDAAIVAAANSLAAGRNDKKIIKVMIILFALMQGIMPLIGFFLGNMQVAFLVKYSKIITFIVFIYLGVNMLKESLNEESISRTNNLDLKIIFLQAIATSIDALAVGIVFSSRKINIFTAVALIILITYVTCNFASKFAHKIGGYMKSKTLLFAGILLISMAIKAVF